MKFQILARGSLGDNSYALLRTGSSKSMKVWGQSMNRYRKYY